MAAADPRTKKALLAEIRRRAPFYVPQWRINPGEPDAGAALAMIWADMLSGAIDRYNRAPENYRRALLDAMGREPGEPLPAAGYLCFRPMAGTGSAVVPARTGVAAPAEPDAVLETEEELEALEAEIAGVFLADPERDACSRHCRTEPVILFGNAGSGEHKWIFTHPYAFDVSPGAALRLRADGDLSGAAWRLRRDGEWIGVPDETDSGGDISLRLPEDTGGLCDGMGFTVTGGNRGLLSGLYAFPAGKELVPEALYAGDAEADEKGFYPFGTRFIPYGCFYLSCREALSKPGARVTLSFDMRVEALPAEGYPQPPVIRRNIMRPEELLPPAEYEIAISQTVWEYYNGTGWAALRLDDPQADNFFSMAGKELRRYTLRFTCPEDIRPVICGAHDALFIRARIVSVDNLYRMNSHYLAPWVERPRFGYRYPEGIRLEKGEVEENLGLREVSLSAPAEICGRVLAEHSVCLAFDRPFSSGSILFVLAAKTAAPPVVWEYYTGGEWIPLEVDDGTEGFGKTGITAYRAANPPEKHRLMGLDAYWMRIVDRAGGYASPEGPRPVLTGIYENAVPARARHPGEASNLPAGEYRVLAAAVPGIAGAYNPLPVRGGCSAEDEDRLIRRLTAAFSNSGRAVSRRDTEELAMEASLRVLRCRCFPFTGAEGEKSPAEACLVIVWDGAGQEDFQPLRERIREYLAARSPLAFGAASCLHIIEPLYIPVNVSLEAVLSGEIPPSAVKRELLERLERYLDPILGGPDNTGWEVGSIPSPRDLAAVAEDIQGLDYIASLQVTYTRTGETGNAPMSYRNAASLRFTLPVKGQIVVRN